MGKPTIYLRSTAAPFEQLGSGNLTGVWPENVHTQHGPNGLEQATFDLRRDPGVDWPDLLPFTPVVIYDDGLVSGTGRIQETPTQHGGSDDKLQVVVEGWQAHLSDNAMQLRLVHNDVSAWLDHRRFPSVSLATFSSAFDVVQGDGAATIALPAGKTAANLSRGCVSLDMGVGQSCKRIVVTYTGGGAANLAMVLVGSDAPEGTDEVFTLDAAPIATVATTVAQTFTTARRYIQLEMANGSGAGVAGSDTAWLRIESVFVVSDTAFEAGNVPILKASDVLTRVLPFAPLLNQSTLDIAATSFNMPHFDGPWATPRDYIEAPNAYHGWQWKVQDDPAGGQPRLRFRAVPTVPLVLARVAAGIEFADASRNDGGDIYNRCVVHYTDAVGNDAYLERTTAAALGSGAVFDTLSTVAAGPNPGFETAGGPPATGWAIISAQGQITRDTGVIDTGTASGRLTSTAERRPYIYTTATGLTPGKSYQLRYRVRAAATWTTGTITAQAQTTLPPSNVTLPPAIGGDSFTSAIGTSFTTRSYNFIAPPSGSVNLVWTTWGAAQVDASVDILYLDGLTLLEAKPTIPDRQGFVRSFILETGSKLTAAAATQFADVFLLAHQSSPLRGTLTVTGPALTDIVSGAPIPIGLLGRYVGDPVLITESDPDTAAQGRVGIIAACDIDHAANTASIAIDSRKDFLDVLKNRFSLFQGGA